MKNALAPQLNYDFTFNAVGASPSIDIRGRGLGFFKIAYINTGTTLPTVATLLLQTSPDNITWSTGITADASTNGQSAITAINTSYIRLNLTVFTKASVSSITANIVGYVTDPTLGSGDIVGPAIAVDGNVALFDGTSGNLLKDGGAFVAPLPLSYLDTDATLANNSDAKVASQKAIKAYIAANASNITAPAGEILFGNSGGDGVTSSSLFKYDAAGLAARVDLPDGSVSAAYNFLTHISTGIHVTNSGDGQPTYGLKLNIDSSGSNIVDNLTGLRVFQNVDVVTGDSIIVHIKDNITSAVNDIGLLIDDILAGTTANYAIKTGLGLVSFGDNVTIDRDVILDAIIAFSNSESNICIIGANSPVNISGDANVVIGAGEKNDWGGDHNIAIGEDALPYLTSNGANGANNIAIGRSGSTLETGSNNILIGHDIDVPLADSSYYLNIGDCITGNMTGEKYISINGDLYLDGIILAYSGLLGNHEIIALNTPSIDTVTPITSGGGKTQTYKIVVQGANGGHTEASAGVSTLDGADDLTATDSGNVISWTRIKGDVGGYDIYRTANNGTTPNTLGKIGHVNSGITTYTDVGAAGDAATPPSTNTSGDLVVAGNVTAKDFIMAGSSLKTDTVTGHTGKISAYDVDGAAYVDFITLTNGNTPTCVIQATDFKASDGTSGVSGTITIPAIGTLTIKNGLVTASTLLA